MAILTGYQIPAPANPYKSDVDALIDAGEGAAFELIAPTVAPEGKRGNITTERLKFQSAAREAGYTARVVEDAEHEDGNTRLVFILTEKRAKAAKGEGKSAKKSDKPAE